MEIKMLVNKKTDTIIGRVEKEVKWHGCKNVFLLTGKSNFVTAGSDYEVRKFKSRTIMKKLFFILLVVLFAGCTVRPVEGSDMWYVEKIAKEHPDWSYNKIEDKMFLSDSIFTDKYGEK